MGINGLTTFIAQNSNKYFKNVELHNTFLVVDGNNLAVQLYKWHAKCYDCFGGDYDKYAKSVVDFFTMLSDCCIRPIVIYDGGYEDNKLKTIYSRVKTRIRQARCLNCVTEKSMSVFPLFLRELFVELTLKLQKQLKMYVVRCLLEADNYIAALAKELDCPILSYDSDFYILDVKYIPFDKLDMQGIQNRHLSGRKQKILPCQLYRVENFLRDFKGLQKNCLPLLSVLSGNDYIQANVFRDFYSQLKLDKRNKNKSDQQRRIKAVLEFLRVETYDTAVGKILGRVKATYRNNLLKKITDIKREHLDISRKPCGKLKLYSGLIQCEKCNLKNFSSNDLNKTGIQSVNCRKSKIIKTASGQFSDSLMTVLDVENVPEDELEDVSEPMEKESTSSSEKSVETDKKHHDGRKSPTFLFNENHICTKSEETDEDIQLSSFLPQFYKDQHQKCLYPAPFIDILIHNRFFFVPQIENYSCKIPAHSISLPIMSAVYKILTPGDAMRKLEVVMRNSNGRMDFLKLEKSTKNLPSLKALEKMSISTARGYLFDVLEVDDRTFKVVNEFPSDWKLFLLSVIYWIKNSSPQVHNCHIYALILGAIILKLDITYCRHEGHLRRFENEIKTIEANNPPELIVNNKITSKEAIKSISKSDSIMLLKQVITYFRMSEKLEKNPNGYDLSIIHAFAQFQSCAFHIKYLNHVLNEPIDDYLISDFYNGTLIYNLTANFLSRTSLDEYMKIFLRYCPGAYKAFTKIKVSAALVTGSWSTNVTGKRKRKRNKKGSNIFGADVCSDVDEEEPDEKYVDSNNKFALLAIADK